MENRYVTLFKKEYAEHLEENACIVACALLKDTVTETLLAQIKLKNCSKNEIFHTEARLSLFDSTGNNIGTEIFSYNGPAVAPGEYFGSKSPIVINDNNVRMFTAKVIEISFNNPKDK